MPNQYEIQTPGASACCRLDSQVDQSAQGPPHGSEMGILDVLFGLSSVSELAQFFYAKVGSCSDN